MTILEEIVSKPPVYLGNKEFLSEVWRVFSETPVWNLQDLERQLSKKQYGQYPYINGGVRLLRFAGVLLGSDYGLRMASDLPGGEHLYEAVVCRLIGVLHRTGDFIRVFPAGAVSIDVQDCSICLTRSFMDFKYAPIWNLLADILSAEQSSSRRKIHFTSTDALLDAFSLNIVEKNRVLSQRDLEEMLRNQSLAGAEAEKAALKYEKRRLCRRSDLSYVKIISNYNVNASYDIISYDSNESRSLDRFIEVKSFIGSRPQFHWSSNEVETAKKYGDQYFIYLVDRAKMSSSDFRPIVIQNPVRNVLESVNWNLFPDSLFCQATDEITV